MGSDSSSEESPERRFRTLFISDVHLGARGSQADRLLDFLRTHDADTIYLVGDIVDGWALKSNWYWPQSHNDFVQKMLRKARKGAKVIYVPGNHDEFLRNYYGTHFGGIDVVENTVHDRRRRQALPRHPRRYLRSRGAERALARPSRRQGLRFRDPDEPARQLLPPHVRRALLVAVAMGEAEGQERGQLYRRVRADAGRRGAASRRRRRDLRPHPLRHHPRRARHPLHELRRLGGKLHGAGRARGRPVRDHHLDRSAAPAGAGVPASRRAPHDAYPGRDRCVASAGQRGGADADHDGGSGQGFWRRRQLPHAAIVPHLRDAELSGFAARAAVSGEDRGTDRGRQSPTAFISRPKVRSGCWCGAIAASTDLPFTTSFHTRFPEYVSARLADPGIVGLAGAALVSTGRARR